MDRSNSGLLLAGSCLAALAVTVLVHAVYVPRYLPGAFTRGLPYLVVGWASYGLLFYFLGRSRLRDGGRPVPNMRAADVGIALFLFSIVGSGLLETAGLTLAGAAAFHVPSAVGVYAGLALAGWGFGRRTRAVNEIAAERQSPP